MHLLNETVLISIKISLKFIPKGPINNIPALVQIMAWRRPGAKPLSEPMLPTLLTHIYVTRPQWVKSVSPKLLTADPHVMMRYTFDKSYGWFSSDQMNQHDALIQFVRFLVLHKMYVSGHFLWCKIYWLLALTHHHWFHWVKFNRFKWNFPKLKLGTFS